MHPTQPPLSDPGAQAMHSAAMLNSAGTIATAELVGGLSGLLVGEGLARLLREMLGTTPAPRRKRRAAETADDESEETAGAEPAGHELAAVAADALRDLVVQGVVGRIVALNTINAYLSIGAAQQVNSLGSMGAAQGTNTATGVGTAQGCLNGANQASVAPPAAQPAAPPVAQPQWPQPTAGPAWQQCQPQHASWGIPHPQLPHMPATPAWYPYMSAGYPPTGLP